MNKEDKEMEYQKGIDELYNQTQEFGRIDFVKALFDIKKELDIANKKLERIKNHVQTQQSIIKRQPSADRSIDDYILARLDTILEIIGGNDDK